MGTSISKPSPLASTFERMETWDLKSSRRLLQDYKDKDLDFGLDAQGLAELLGGDKEWAESIIDAFRSSTSIINALAFICGACLVSSGPALEKAGMVFEALDFDGTEQISMDEMVRNHYQTISFLCCARGFCVIAGVGSVPSDDELESVTLQAYRDLNKGSTQSITKSEFTKWVLKFASGSNTPPTREVILQDVLEQFRVVPPAIAEENANNNDYDPLYESTEAIEALHHDEIVHPDENYTDELQQQEGDLHSENAIESVAEEGYEIAEQTGELSKLIEPANVLDGDERFSTEGELVSEEHKDFTQFIDENYEAQSQVTGDVTVDQASEGQETLSDIEPVESIVYEVEAQYYPQDNAQTESDNAISVAEPEGLPQGAALQGNELQECIDADQEDTIELHAEASGEEIFDLELVEQSSALEKIAADELQESINAADQYEDDFAYEQEEFAEVTSQTDFGDDAVDVNAVHGNAESSETTEVTEPPQIKLAAEVPIEPEVLVGEDETTNINQELAPSDTQTDETSATDIAQDEQSVDVVALNTVETELEDTDYADVSPPVDLNAFDTYDFESPQFDGSSGLPPPEPPELLENSLDENGDVPELGADPHAE